MAEKVGSIYVDLDLDHSKYDRGSRKVEASNKKMATSMSDMESKTGKLKVALGLAAVAAVAFGVSCVKSFMDSENQIAQTEAVIKSTGGVAGVTAKDVSRLASSLQKNTAFSDEQVRSAENMALTFTGIGKDIFPEVTKTALDMATALNHGITPSGEEAADTMKLLGKALQDPDAGLGALKRVGVNVDELSKKFTDGMSIQEKQKLILKELSTEFGGSAASAANTYAGKIQKIKNQFDDMKEVIGKLIVDNLTKLSKWATDHQGTLKKVALVVLGLAVAWAAWAVAMDLLAASQAVFLALSSPTIIALWGMEAPLLLIELAVAGVVLAIGGFIAGLVLLYNKNEWFHDFVTVTWGKIQVAIKDAWENHIRPAFDKFKEAWDRLIDTIKQFMERHPEVVEALKMSAAIIGAVALIGLDMTLKAITLTIASLSFMLDNLGSSINVVSGMWDGVGKAWDIAFRSALLVMVGFLKALDKIPDVIKNKIGLGRLGDVIANLESMAGTSQVAANETLRTTPSTASTNTTTKGRFRASGGYQNKFEPGIVGEMGPELFVPDTPGHIISAQQTGEALKGNNITINVDMSKVMATSRAQIREVGNTFIEAVNEGLIARGIAPIADNKVRGVM